MADWVDFAYWWSCIGKGLCPQHAQQMTCRQDRQEKYPPKKGSVFIERIKQWDTNVRSYKCKCHSECVFSYI